MPQNPANAPPRERDLAQRDARRAFVHDAFGVEPFVHEAFGAEPFVHDAFGAKPFVHEASAPIEFVQDAAAPVAGSARARARPASATVATFRAEMCARGARLSEAMGVTFRSWGPQRTAAYQ